MATLRARHLIGGLLILGAMGYLAYAANSSAWTYYRDVDAFVLTQQSVGTRARVHGRIDSESADIRPVDLTAKFQLMGASQRLQVEYHGPVPNLLVPGGQVVAEGVLDQAGVFQADTLLTKCASKYEGHGETGPPQAGAGSR